MERAWWDTSAKAPPPSSNQCFALTYGKFSAVFWPCLYFFLLLLPILESWFYLGSRTTTLKMAWPCRAVSALHPCSAAQRHLTEGHLQLEGLWLTEETPEHETTRINRLSPHQLQINCAIKQNLNLNCMFVCSFNIGIFKFSINWDDYIPWILFNCSQS